MNAITTQRQLSMDILPHPEVQRREAKGDHVWLQGELEAKLAVPVGEDLNAGDRLIVTVAGDDGEILARHYLEVGRVYLEPIEDRDLGVIGTRRVHNAKLVD